MNRPIVGVELSRTPKTTSAGQACGSTGAGAAGAAAGWAHAGVARPIVSTVSAASVGRRFMSPPYRVSVWPDGWLDPWIFWWQFTQDRPINRLLRFCKA